MKFSELRRRLDQISSSTLTTRLQELAEARIVMLRKDRYQLAKLGFSLLLSIGPLELSAKTWAAATTVHDIEPANPDIMGYQ
ncbi:winged helix-turn-helix transcriptional regulator [Mycobacteroides salmoniphilum]|uniref:winged helix-turn-helix transcriptional regulator n=1 Tax=Mycobacteroides salmoniphilum TaxID=404941 RepID=UPI0010660AD5